jgi:hypothetical protein
VTLRGGCLCGGVRYEIEGALEAPEHCHCSMCRKAHGAAFSTNAVVDSARLTLTDALGLLTEYESSPHRRKCFCGRCGSQLFIRRGNRPDVTVVTLGTLDDDPACKPSRHVFVGYKAPWYDVEDGLPRYLVYPGFEPADEAGDNADDHPAPPPMR